MKTTPATSSKLPLRPPHLLEENREERRTCAQILFIFLRWAFQATLSSVPASLASIRAMRLPQGGKFLAFAQRVFKSTDLPVVSLEPKGLMDQLLTHYLTRRGKGEENCRMRRVISLELESAYKLGRPWDLYAISCRLLFYMRNAYLLNLDRKDLASIHQAMSSIKGQELADELEPHFEELQKQLNHLFDGSVNSGFLNSVNNQLDLNLQQKQMMILFLWWIDRNEAAIILAEVVDKIGCYPALQERLYLNSFKTGTPDLSYIDQLSKKRPKSEFTRWMIHLAVEELVKGYRFKTFTTGLHVWMSIEKERKAKFFIGGDEL